MLTKDLLRVSRAGGGYHPQFVDREFRPLAARVIGTFQGHVGRRRADLEAALEELERADAGPTDRFKIVRGFAALCERDATFETRADLPPERVRRTVFRAATEEGVVTEAERDRALAAAADRLGTDPATVERSLYADRDRNRILTGFEPRWGPDELLTQYNLSLAQTALFDAVELRVRSVDPKALVSAVKRNGLMYEVHVDDDGRREVVATGPDALFRRTRRYGTAFARLLRSVAGTADWRLRATIDDRGTEREMVLTDDDVSVPGVDAVAEPGFDSDVEADFAARFRALDLDWRLVREPEPLRVDGGRRVMIPDFAFDYAPGGTVGSAGEAASAGEADRGFRVYFEIMGFWTPEYVEKKLGQIAGLEDVDLLVAVDESLGAGEAVEARDARAVTYSGSVRVKDVVDRLREHEADLVADAAADLPDELTPDADVTSLEALAAELGVSADALEGAAFPDHERVGRTLVRPGVLDDLRERVEPGMAFEEAESVLAEYGVDDASAVLSALGYRVAWTGLGGGELRAK